MMPHTLPQSYVRWIRKQGAKELYVWQGVRVSKDTMRQPYWPGADFPFECTQQLGTSPYNVYAP